MPVYTRVLTAVLLTMTVTFAAAEDRSAARTLRLSELDDARVLPAGEAPRWRAMVRDDLNRRMAEVNRASRTQTARLRSKQQWEDFCSPKLKALAESLGQWPSPPEQLQVRVTSTFDGDGFQVHNVLFQTRRGWWVTANLYRPHPARASMPGIILSHSHHRPKEQGELQDMGMSWARAGCLVLVPDHLGHGERRQHPFATSGDFRRPFRVSRQDYYFRYDTAIQLHLVGESLMGWMVWDLMRGVDLLLDQKGVDPRRIVILGSVAGGGDPAAVTAALDQRITCAVPFNFGGPQPETRYPLPEDSETTFNYAGGGSWESTRNLRRSAADGFLPYVIVGGIAPRRLIFAHEFNWHRQRDPVWQRLETIYRLHDSRANLAYTHGRGELRGRPPEATHCTNIGAYHRRLIHQAFSRWFDLDISEYSQRMETSKLHCMTKAAHAELSPERLVDLLPGLAQQRLGSARDKREGLSPAALRRKLRTQLAELLGPVESAKASGEAPTEVADFRLKGDADLTISVSRVQLTPEAGITTPMLVLRRTDDSPHKAHAVIGLAQSGKAGFLRHRSDEIVDVLRAGYTVCLPDLRGTGETRAGDSRVRQSTDTSRSATELMLGGTTLGCRLRDLRAVIRYLRSEPYGTRRFTLWGDSFAPVNADDAQLNVPRRIDGRPRQSEPSGPVLALLGAVYEDDVRSVYLRGGLLRFSDVLEHQQVLIPDDIVVPGLLTVADIDDLAAAIAPRPLALRDMVNHLNQRVPAHELSQAFPHTLARYRHTAANLNLPHNGSVAQWLETANR